MNKLIALRIALAAFIAPFVNTMIVIISSLNRTVSLSYEEAAFSLLSGGPFEYAVLWTMEHAWIYAILLIGIIVVSVMLHKTKRELRENTI